MIVYRKLFSEEDKNLPVASGLAGVGVGALASNKLIDKVADKHTKSVKNNLRKNIGNAYGEANRVYEEGRKAIRHSEAFDWNPLKTYKVKRNAKKASKVADAAARKTEAELKEKAAKTLSRITNRAKTAKKASKYVAGGAVILGAGKIVGNSIKNKNKNIPNEN